MPHINKKGIAEVITVITIILITISAIAIFTAGFLKEVRSLSPEISCTQFKINNPLTFQEACFNSESNRIEVKIKRSLNDLDFENLKFTASQDSLKESWQCGSLCGACNIPTKGATQTYYLSLEDTTYPSTLTVSIEGCALESKKLLEC